jgi:hypothetical protein
MSARLCYVRKAFCLRFVVVVFHHHLLSLSLVRRTRKSGLACRIRWLYYSCKSLRNDIGAVPPISETRGRKGGHRVGAALGHWASCCRVVGEVPADCIRAAGRPRRRKRLLCCTTCWAWGDPMVARELRRWVALVRFLDLRSGR